VARAAGVHPGTVSRVLHPRTRDLVGSEHVEGVNAISGERCSPHPHVYTDRAFRPGDPAYFDILEKPIISRLVSLDHPEEIQEGMVFALETFWPASDGWQAARIEEQLVVRKDGAEVITRP